MSDAGERNGKSILKLALFSGFSSYDSAAGPKAHSKCASAASRYSRIFTVGLGIVAAMTALPRSQLIPIDVTMTKPRPGLTFLKDKEDAELSESYTCVIWHLGGNRVKKRVYLGDGDNGLLLERPLLPIEHLNLTIGAEIHH